MYTRFAKHEKEDLHSCKCSLCEHDWRHSCIEGKCYCCDLEDSFALLTRQEFEFQSRLVTEERTRKEAMAA